MKGYLMKVLIAKKNKESKLELNKSLKYDKTLKFNNVIIKKSDSFTVYKELCTGVYILSLSNLIIISYKKKNLEDFEYLYSNNLEYSFNVYINNNNYYIICVSKYKSDTFNYNEWLESNECNKKYNYLSKVYNSFLIMNRHWYYKNDYKFEKTIGKGKINLEINNLVKYYINMINTNNLPPHYLKLK